MWFDRGEIMRATGGSAREANLMNCGVDIAQSRRRCPACSVLLHQRETEKDTGIWIDQCVRCGGIYLDRGEYDRLKAHYGTRRAPTFKRVRSAPTAPATHTGDGSVLTVNEDNSLVALFQYVTGLPLEEGACQKLFPPVTGAIVLLNIAVFVFALAMGFEDTMLSLAAVPADLLKGRELHTLLTSMFAHAGIGHILGNMYFLYLAGDNVEERFGWGHFLWFYLLCGLAAMVGHMFAEPDLGIPVLGASGAISGVLGAYVILFPQQRFMFRWFIYWTPVRFSIPAWGYFAFWIAVQVLFLSIGVGGVAWGAHLGGFAVGVAWAVLLKRADRRRAALA